MNKLLRNDYSLFRGGCEQRVKFPRDLYNLCNKILKLSPWNVIAILLAGSLSSGEGTIIRNGNNVHVLSDYDLEVIVRFYNPIFVRSLNKLEKESSLKVRIGVIPAFSLKHLKLIQMYELKKKGLLLLGNREVLNQISMDVPSDIPLLEGIRRLLNGIIEMIEALNYDDIGSKISDRQSHRLIYSSSKAYLACSSALLTLIGKYRPSFRDRCKLFNKFFKVCFKELREKFPDFPEKVQKALNFKLYAELNDFNESLEEWFNAKSYIIATLEYYLTKYFSETGFNLFKLLQKLETLPIQPIFNIYYAFNSLLFLKKIPPLKSFFTVPMISIQISGVYLMTSINKQGSIDLQMLKKAAELIGRVYSVKKLNLDWNELRNIVIKTWKIAPEYTSR